MKSYVVPRGRVLIVDDQLDIREGIKALLEYEGFDVITHDSMITLPLILRNAAPDVILLDIGMGTLSGEAFFQLDRERLRCTGTSVILFSGRPARELAEMAETLGADGFVSKSQTAMEVVASVQTSIDQRRALRAAQGRTFPNVGARTAFASAQ